MFGMKFSSLENKYKIKNGWLKYKMKKEVQGVVVLFPFGHTASIMTEWDELQKRTMKDSCPVD